MERIAIQSVKESGSRGERIACAGIVLLALVAVVLGWRTFWFLVDDAFIAFRYVRNSHLGHGYVWNPPPFRAVEGYTSFLWVVILDAGWHIFGSPPPELANRLSLAASLGALLVTAALARRTTRWAPTSALRVTLFGILLFAVVTNRTFLAWTSSGLETSLQTLLVLAWTYRATDLRSRTAFVELAALAAALSLCRPDGLLFVAITFALIAWVARRRPAAWASALPLTVTVVHLLWRHRTYGEWVPNTYVAKHVAPWPLAGAIYLSSFLLEYGFVWVPIFAAVALSTVRRARLTEVVGGGELGAGRVAAVTALVLQTAYYTFIIGGDHFEFRVYQHLVPLLCVVLPLLLHISGFDARRCVLLMALTCVVGLVLPWIHHFETRNIRERGHRFIPIAWRLPPVARSYGQLFDATQRWLVGHGIGIRHHSHRVFCEVQLRKWPADSEGARISDPEDIPVLPVAAVGVPGWVLPNVAIVDLLGLNDAVIARTPARHEGQQDRWMAHDRRPPPGYVACFRPNVEESGLVIKRRDRPLTRDDIVRCETKWRARVSAGAVGSVAPPR